MISYTPEETETGFELKKRVSWKGIFIREYNTTKGDHPMCSDNLPVSLDWSHSDDVFKTIDESRERNSKYVFPRRLTYEDRRKRVFGEEEEEEEELEERDGVIMNSVVDYWDQSAAFAGNEAQQNSLMDFDDLIQQESAELDAEAQVFYCRHVRDFYEDDEDDDEEEDSDFLYFLNWRRIASI